MVTQHSRGLIEWKDADFYKWAGLWTRCVVFPLHWRGFGHVWWLIELENTWLHSARKPWNCQSAFHPSSRAETDSGGQTDDLSGLNTLNLTIPCWQPVEECWVVNGRVLGNTSLSAFQGFSHSVLPLSLSLCRSSVTLRLMRVYRGLCACLLAQNWALNGKQQCVLVVWWSFSFYYWILLFIIWEMKKNIGFVQNYFCKLNQTAPGYERKMWES